MYTASKAEGYLARPVSNREWIARIDAMVRILNAELERDGLIIKKGPLQAG